MCAYDDSSRDSTYCFYGSFASERAAISDRSTHFDLSYGITSAWDDPVVSRSCFRNGFAWKRSVLANRFAENMGIWVSSLVSSRTGSEPIFLLKVNPKDSSGAYTFGFRSGCVSLRDSCRRLCGFKLTAGCSSDGLTGPVLDWEIGSELFYWRDFCCVACAGFVGFRFDG